MNTLSFEVAFGGLEKREGLVPAGQKLRRLGSNHQVKRLSEVKIDHVALDDPGPLTGRRGSRFSRNKAIMSSELSPVIEPLCSQDKIRRYDRVQDARGASVVPCCEQYPAYRYMPLHRPDLRVVAS